MATIFSHPAIALGLFPWFRDVRNHKKILFTGALLTIAPDLDVLGLYAGIPYEHMLGHRGLSHSLLFAAFIAALHNLAFFASNRDQSISSLALPVHQHGLPWRA